MADRKIREQEMADEKAQAIFDIVVQNFGAKVERANAAEEEAKVRCLYDCDCTIIGGTDPYPPYGTAAAVAGYFAGTLI